MYSCNRRSKKRRLPDVAVVPLKTDPAKLADKMLRTPKCSRCRNHGFLVPVKGHSGKCRWKQCTCEKCYLITERQKIMAAQKMLKKQAGEEEQEAAGPCPPGPELATAAAAPGPSFRPPLPPAPAVLPAAEPDAEARVAPCVAPGFPERPPRGPSPGPSAFQPVLGGLGHAGPSERGAATPAPAAAAAPSPAGLFFGAEAAGRGGSGRPAFRGPLPPMPGPPFADFVWPHRACAPGFPGRGSHAVPRLRLRTLLSRLLPDAPPLSLPARPTAPAQILGSHFLSSVGELCVRWGLPLNISSGGAVGPDYLEREPGKLYPSMRPFRPFPLGYPDAAPGTGIPLQRDFRHVSCTHYRGGDLVSEPVRDFPPSFYAPPAPPPPLPQQPQFLPPGFLSALHLLPPPPPPPPPPTFSLTILSDTEREDREPTDAREMEAGAEAPEDPSQPATQEKSD
ncbi:doublesex- and mab-3-related transcription factor B1 [Sorex araneus]|uniref:doublesex- and mab-3-related transcription factor B1 n=1 Tax=Sorex araneus TaxID=42254 RepID=UPI002433CC1D|nr:doublesex- and mab-3-related transcription factor B1 [Sorex araneus]